MRRLSTSISFQLASRWKANSYSVHIPTSSKCMSSFSNTVPSFPPLNWFVLKTKWATVKKKEKYIAFLFVIPFYSFRYNMKLFSSFYFEQTSVESNFFRWTSIGFQLSQSLWNTPPIPCELPGLKTRHRRGPSPAAVVFCDTGFTWSNPLQSHETLP